MRKTLTALGLIIFLLLPQFGIYAEDEVNLAYPPEIVAWSDDVKQKQRSDAVEIQNKINDAIKNGAESLVIPKGDYRFANELISRLEIKEAKNLTVNFSGSTLWFEGNGQGMTSALNISSCENCKFENFYIDYDPMPYIQGVITSVNADDKTLSIKIDKGFYYPDETWLKTSGSQMKTIFFDKNGEMLQTPMNWVAEKDGFELVDKENIKVKLMRSSAFEGETYEDLKENAYRVVIPWRRNVGVKISYCDSVTLEDMTIYADPGTGIFETYGKGNTLLKRVNMIRRPETKRMLVSNADAIHTYGTENVFNVEDCRVEYSGDDLINSNAYYQYVYQVIDDTHLLIATIYNYKLKKGENLKFIDLENWSVLGSADIKRLTSIQDQKLTENILKMRQSILREVGIGVRTEFPYPKLYYVELSEPVKVKNFDMIETGNASKGFVARNSEFIGSVANGIRVRTADTLIENCVFSKSQDAGILLGSSCFWSEGADMYNVVIKNNTFESNAKSFSGEAEGDLVMINEPGDTNKNFNYNIQSRDFEISGNTFINPVKHAISISNTENVKIDDNKVIWNENPLFRPNEKTESVFWFGAVKNVQGTGNTFLNVPSFIKEKTGISEKAENVDVN